MEEARAACEGAEAVLIAAGAGIGVDSGSPISGETRAFGELTRRIVTWVSVSWKWPRPRDLPRPRIRTGLLRTSAGALSKDPAARGLCRLLEYAPAFHKMASQAIM